MAKAMEGGKGSLQTTQPILQPVLLCTHMSPALRMPPSTGES